ncbi:MAG: hypothetical protein WBH43_04790, partial [Aquiluna sp.]
VSRHNDSLPFLGDLFGHTIWDQFNLRKTQIFLTAVMLMHCFYVNALLLGLCLKSPQIFHEENLANNPIKDLR